MQEGRLLDHQQLRRTLEDRRRLRLPHLSARPPDGLAPPERFRSSPLEWCNTATGGIPWSEVRSRLAVLRSKMWTIGIQAARGCEENLRVRPRRPLHRRRRSIASLHLLRQAVPITRRLHPQHLAVFLDRIKASKGARLQRLGFRQRDQRLGRRRRRLQRQLSLYHGRGKPQGIQQGTNTRRPRRTSSMPRMTTTRWRWILSRKKICNFGSS